MRHLLHSAGRILFLVALIVLCLLSPVLWQAAREWHRRGQVQKNLQQYREALDAYHARDRQR